jgi:plasmid maintenance system killer protein
MLTAMIAAEDMARLHGPRGWRITFDIEDGEIANLDLEDYH